MGLRWKRGAWALLLGSLACEASAGGGIAAPVADTVYAEGVVRIGAMEGAEAYLFGAITSVAADADGRVYVADRIGSSVRVFDAAGGFVGWLGREGDGPGEFQWPNDLRFGEDGRLYVRDGSRVTVFERSAGSAFPDRVVATWRIPGYANLDSRRARAVGGLYYYPGYVFRRDEPPRYLYLAFDSAGHSGDTLHVPALPNLAGTTTAFYMVSQGSGRMVEGLSAPPFAPQASWDMTSRGTLVGGGGEAFLHEFSATGDTLRTIAVPGAAARPVPSGELRDSLEALEARIDSLPVPLSDVQGVSAAVVARQLPDSLPAYLATHIGEGDRIWLERWPSEGEAGAVRIYDVLAYDGTHLGTVRVPLPLLRDPPPFFGLDVLYGAVRDPQTEVESVVGARFDLKR